MYQFTKQQVEDFRSRGKQTEDVIIWLLKETETIRNHELIIPQTGCATWQLYYYCPECSVRLEFDIDSPKAYRCPTCGKYWHGEPYEGAWWRWLNTFNYTSTYYLSLLYLLTGDTQYADRARAVLTTYATYYPDYKVHGDIPYNKPGRANSQVLDEAIMLRYYALTYDIIEDTLSEEDKKLIKTNYFRIGADHLKKYRTDQLHNHEVDVDSTMAVLGILLNDEQLINHALYEPYGLYYQLEKAVLADGFWFECSSAYHFFALMNFFAFEKFALYTKWSNINHPNYRRMLLFACKILKSDYNLPMLNDCMRHLSNPDAYDVFEFGYNMFRDEEMLAVLQNKYRDSGRKGIEAFFYGVRNLPTEAARITASDYHDETGSGITVLHRAGDQYLIMKHGPYGGEHDHYDKLEISYSRESNPVFEDLGTTGYGAVLHYGYFKNSISHNTITLNEANQAPACGKVNRFENHGEYSLLDCEVTWDKDYQGPDSYIIKQWDTEAYDKTYFRRQIVFADEYIIDVEDVRCPSERKIDNSIHFGGKLLCKSHHDDTLIEHMDTLGKDKPYKYFTDCSVYAGTEDTYASYQVNDIVTDLYTMAFDGKIVFTQAPFNPSTFNIPYVIERTVGNKACFAHLFAVRKFSDTASVSNVAFTKNNKTLTVSFTVNGIDKKYSFDI